MRSLANEIARGLEPLDDILRKHRVSPAYFQSLEKNPRFHAMVILAAKEWSAADNVTKRTELKAALMFEEALPEFFARMHDTKESLAAKVEFMKLLGKTAKLGTQEQTRQQGETLRLVINLGSDQQLEISKELPSKVINHDDFTGEFGE